MKLRAWWEERTSSERWALGIGAPLLVATLVAAAIFAFRPTYEVLFSGLDAQNITAIANQLTSQGVAYRVDEDGGRILVRQADVRDARMRVMEAGIPLNRPVGFELFDHVDFGMTEFTQRINYERALEGELTRTITSLKEVDHARVHLVLPESTLFGAETAQPKAAVALSIKPGMTLGAERISGIQRLIAYSVPGLVPSAVAIHDDKGLSLVSDTTSGDQASPSTRIEDKKVTEAYLAQKAQLMLDHAFGEGSALVVVDADVDRDQRKFVRDEVIPVNGGATGAVTNLRYLTGGISKKAAEPEATGEDDDGAVVESAPPPESRKRQGEITTEVKYEPGRQHETVTVGQGAIKRLTVSVLVPPRTAEAVRQAMFDVVANAVGLRRDRGDLLSIQDVPSPAMSPSSAAVNPPPLVLQGRREGVIQKITSDIYLLLAFVGAVLLGITLTYILTGRPRPVRLTPEKLDRLRQELRRWVDEDKEAGTVS